MEEETKVEQRVKREYRDTVFRMIFREKKALLSLYNAIHETTYEDEGQLVVNTLENAIYMAMKNDVSFILDCQMNLYEHQSTINPNMPLRYLFYVADLYEVLMMDEDIYSSRCLALPAPEFIILYNGKEDQPERKFLCLSDAYRARKEKPALELTALQLNINPGYNEELKRRCPLLSEYIQYTERVQCYREFMPLAKAVEQAVEECIREGVLTDFLKKNKAEVVKMSIYEYDEEKHLRNVKAEGREEGIKKVICTMLRNNQEPEFISSMTEEPLEYVYQIREEMTVQVREEDQYMK